MSEFSLGQLATLACLLEISAPKPGNVHRGAEFHDMSFEQMLCGALAIGPAIEQAREHGVGSVTLDAVKATQDTAGTNTNLGTILLMAPLAAVTDGQPLREGVADVLGSLTAEDAMRVYEAIRLAQPGGLGRVAEHDIQAAPPEDLLAAMEAAADRDLIAAQYASNFAALFDFVVPRLQRNLRDTQSRLAIVQTHVELMAEFPDSLICRKRGKKVADESAARAQQVLRSGEMGSNAYQRALADLDFWLRADGNARNPGTTADMIAAAIFILLRQGVLSAPFPLKP